MEIEKRRMEGGYVLFTASGELTLRTGKSFVDPIIREIAAGQCRKIGVDLSRVRYMDSFGIGCILKCNNAMEERRGVVGEIVFLISERLRKKLAVVGLDRLLKYEIVPDASFRAENPSPVEPPPEAKP